MQEYFPGHFFGDAFIELKIHEGIFKAPYRKVTLSETDKMRLDFYLTDAQAEWRFVNAQSSVPVYMIHYPPNAHLAPVVACNITVPYPEIKYF